MPYLLDTNACITHLRTGGVSKVSRRIRAAQVDQIVLCSVVCSELLFGARRSQNVARNLAEITSFIAQFRSFPFDALAAEENARLRADLETLGQRIGPFDSLIAAIAIANDLTLVTLNTSEFSRVKSLRIEDWQ